MTASSVLIVEDEVLVRELTALEFEDAGFTVFAAADGDTALAILGGDTPIDLLFTDISLADSIDGWTLAAAARQLRPGLPIIYATGFSPDPVKIVEGGRFFKKPYLPWTIIAAARELMGDAKAR